MTALMQHLGVSIPLQKYSYAESQPNSTNNTWTHDTRSSDLYVCFRTLRKACGHNGIEDRVLMIVGTGSDTLVLIQAPLEVPR